MATRNVRRLYLYVAAFIGLQMLAAGIRSLATLLGERWLGEPAYGAASSLALRLGSGVALVLVGLAFWGGHWTLAQRDARQPDGQRSPLRRLYAYAVLLVAALGVMFALQEALTMALSALGQGPGPVALLPPLVSAAVNAVVWAAHWRIFAADRELVEAAGPNATLRRWYLAMARWASLALACFGAGVLIHALLQRFVFNAPGDAWQLAMPAAALISGALIWLPHEGWARRLARAAGPLQADELGSTLHQVYLAVVITSSLIAVLTGLTALIAAGVQAALGVESWAGAFAGETRGAAALIVALPLLLYHRAQLLASAAISGDAGRGDMARRLVSYLTGAVSLVALYFGLGGLSGTLLRLWLGAESVGAAWRTPLSWYTAMTIVALPVYVLASRRSDRLARANPDEERALSRRIYLYAGLLFGVVATVTTATQLIRLLVVAGMGEGAPGTAGEVGRLVAYTLLGLAAATGYGGLLRRAGAARGTAGAGRSIVLIADEPLRQSLAAAMAHELPGATLVAFDERDSPERRAALAGADLLVSSLAALGDESLAAFQGPRLLLATPLAGVTLVGARREGPALAREAARKARGICAAGAPQSPPPTTSSLAAGPA